MTGSRTLGLPFPASARNLAKRPSRTPAHHLLPAPTACRARRRRQGLDAAGVGNRDTPSMIDVLHDQLGEDFPTPSRRPASRPHALAGESARLAASLPAR